MRLSSKEQIIKRQSVSMTSNPKRLGANKTSTPDRTGREEAGQAFVDVLTTDMEEDNQSYENEFGAQAGAIMGDQPSTVPQEGSLLAAVREQAETILGDARAQAETIVHEARLQEGRLRREIFDAVMEEALPKALEEALPQALEEGRERGRQEGLQEMTEATDKVQVFYDMLERAWHDELGRIDEELLDLALKISECMVGTVLKYDKDKLLDMIRSLILLPNERRNLKIVVSDDDWEWLRNLQDKGLPPYPLIRDESLEAGNVLIQSNEGIFDAQLATQLNKFRDVLSEELVNGQLEIFS